MRVALLLTLLTAGPISVGNELCEPETYVATALAGRPVSDWIDMARARQPEAIEILGANPEVALPALLVRKAVKEEHRSADALVRSTARNKGSAVPSLLPFLSCPDPKVREVAVQILAWIGPPAKTALAELVGALSDDAWGVRMQATYALNRVGVMTPEVLAGLRARLGDDAWHVAVGAAKALASQPGRSLPVLMDALVDPDLRTRRYAATAIGKGGATAFPLLLRMLREDTVENQLEAIRALGRLDEATRREAIPLLEARLGHPELRCVAARLLARSEGARSILALPVLVELMKLPRGTDRCTDRASWDVHRIGSAAVPALMELMDHPQLSTRRGALRALAKIRPITQEVLRRLAAALAEEVGPSASEALVEIVGVPAVGVLIEALDNNDPEARRLAAWALGRIGPDAAPAVPKLVERLSRETGNTKRFFIFALGAIGGEEAPAAIPELRTALEDDALRVRAAFALARIAGPEAADVVPILIEALGADEMGHTNIREELLAIGPGAIPAVVREVERGSLWIVHSLDVLGPEALQAARPALESWLRSGDDMHRFQAAKRLVRLDGRATAAILAALVPALSWTNPWFRLDSAEALAELSPDRRSAAISALKELATHRYEKVRERAREALDRLAAAEELQRR